MNVSKHKSCFCYTCNKSFHFHGINRHRSRHRDKKEDCKIRYTNGDIYTFNYSADKKESDK